MNLLDIRPGDLFATPPSSWWGELICKIIKARTFHWGCFLMRDDDGWVITESIGKGVAVTRFNYRDALIYRIKKLRVSFVDVLSTASYYGSWRYDWDVAFKTATWWLLKHYLGKLIPRYRDKEVNCQEYVCLLARKMGFAIIEKGEYPMSINLENSTALEYLGEIKDSK